MLSPLRPHVLTNRTSNIGNTIMSKTLTINVQGKAVNNTIISAFAKRLGSIDDVLSVWANAATLQIVQHGNRNWLDSLFGMPAMRLKNNELSKAGKDVLAYIKAHCPLIVWNKDNQTIGMQKIGKDNVLAHSFIAVGHTAPVESIVTEYHGKFYMPHGDFCLTFNEFKNLAKPEKEVKDSDPSMLASAFIKQADKALLTFEAGRFIGTPEELLTAYVKAKELSDKINAALEASIKLEADKLAKLATIEAIQPGMEVSPADMPIDTVLANQLHQSGQNGKSKRAGGKVEPKVAA